MSHIPYYGEEPEDQPRPPRTQRRPRADEPAPREPDARALRFHVADRGLF